MCVCECVCVCVCVCVLVRLTRLLHSLSSRVKARSNNKATGTAESVAPTNEPCLKYLES